MSFSADIFNLFAKEWALVCAGAKEKNNAMTIAWGGLGTLWGKPVCTVYVHEARYTYDFMEDSDYFTVSFYSDEYREALNVMGSKSGRDCDKPAAAGLTPVALDNGVTFKEAYATVVCRKIYAEKFDIEKVPASMREGMYRDGRVHHMYIGEVMDIVYGEK